MTPLLFEDVVRKNFPLVGKFNSYLDVENNQGVFAPIHSVPDYSSVVLWRNKYYALKELPSIGSITSTKTVVPWMPSHLDEAEDLLDHLHDKLISDYVRYAGGDPGIDSLCFLLRAFRNEWKPFMLCLSHMDILANKQSALLHRPQGVKK